MARDGNADARTRPGDGPSPARATPKVDPGPTSSGRIPRSRAGDPRAIETSPPGRPRGRDLRATPTWAGSPRPERSSWKRRAP